MKTIIISMAMDVLRLANANICGSTVLAVVPLVQSVLPMKYIKPEPVFGQDARPQLNVSPQLLAMWVAAVALRGQMWLVVRILSVLEIK